MDLYKWKDHETRLKPGLQQRQMLRIWNRNDLWIKYAHYTVWSVLIGQNGQILQFKVDVEKCNVPCAKSISLNIRLSLQFNHCFNTIFIWFTTSYTFMSRAQVWPTIMLNHVHVLIKCGTDLPEIIQSWKSYTGKWDLPNNEKLNLGIDKLSKCFLDVWFLGPVHTWQESLLWDCGIYFA